MPWECKTVEETRKEFIEADKQTDNFSQLCRDFNISRTTGYKWRNRNNNGESFSDKSKCPHRIANKTPAEIEELVLRVRSENPGWGARRIKMVLENQGYDSIPCDKTINNILHRHGCISKEESLKRKPFTRFEKENCNDMWQTDFKGEFQTKDELYCYPLTIIDDRSRFSIKIAPYTNTKNVVIKSFKEAFEKFGLPLCVLSDNGPQFAGFRQGYTQFEKFLMNHDVLPVHGRIKHPQTQGKIERFHRTMKSELLKFNEFDDIFHADKALQEWRTKYNCSRPHEALGMKCPADIYRPSNRIYVDKVEKYTYGGEHHVIKVNNWGYVRFAGHQVYLSETMIGEYVEFRPNPDGDSFKVCYRNFVIAEFSTIDGTRLNRHISRL